MRGQDIISADRRIARENEEAEREAAQRALGLAGETGQRVEGMAPGLRHRVGSLVRWEDCTPVVRWDDTGAEQRVDAAFLQLHAV